MNCGYKLSPQVIRLKNNSLYSGNWECKTVDAYIPFEVKYQILVCGNCDENCTFFTAYISTHNGSLYKIRTCIG